MKEEKDEGEGEGEGAIVTTDPHEEKKDSDDAFPTMIRKRGRPRKVIQESHFVQQQQQQHIEETRTTPPLESEGKSKKQKECRINPLPPPALESKSKKEKQTNSTLQEVLPNKSSSTCKQTHVLRREGSRRKGEPRRAAAD